MKKLIFLMGPTSSGKTNLSIYLRNYIPIELVSVDSALIYRGMDIGTAKPSKYEQSLVKHHLLDIVDPSEFYSVAKFRRDAYIKIKNIIVKNKVPVLVGGSMLYYKSLLHGLSSLPPANLSIRNIIKKFFIAKGCGFLHQKLSKIDPLSGSIIHPNDLKRIIRALEVFFISGKTLTEFKKKPKKPLPYQIYQFAILPNDKENLYNKINHRLKKMILAGFEDEVRKLFERKDLNINLPAIRCIGYRQMWKYLSGHLSYNEMINQTIYATRKLVKHQITWLRNWNNVFFINDECIESTCTYILKKINY